MLDIDIQPYIEQAPGLLLEYGSKVFFALLIFLLALAALVRDFTPTPKSLQIKHSRYVCLLKWNQMPTKPSN